MTRIHVGAFVISLTILAMILGALSACEGAGPRNCPPPIGCGR